MTNQSQEPLHLAPHDDERIVVVLSDQARSSAFVLTSSESAVLAPSATDVLHRAFLEVERADTVRLPEPGVADDWTQLLADEHLLQIADTRPELGEVVVSHAAPGDVIAPNPTEGGQDITVEVGGTVLQRRINRTDVYWFEAETDLAAEYGYAFPRQGGGVVARGDIFNTKLMARPVGGGLGVNCAGCAVCAACGGCAGCAICGPSPAAALGIVGVDVTIGVIGVAGSSLAAEALRGR